MTIFYGMVLMYYAKGDFNDQEGKEILDLDLMSRLNTGCRAEVVLSKNDQTVQKLALLSSPDGSKYFLGCSTKQELPHWSEPANQIES